ncbi:MAG: hypothetical protein HY962_14825 [Ignavibacteriae bacterium]|nr:hypothetical protein [Ignavibacteriota bacterium]
MWKNSRHAVLILSLTGAVLVLVFFTTGLLRPESFGKHGHFRWNALQEIRAQGVALAGTKTCIGCHKDVWLLHEKDAHYNVPCVDCHGANARHVAYHRRDPGSDTISATGARMPREYTLEGCLFCHRQLKARPKDFPQVDPRAHYTFLHVNDPTTPCIACHNPHEPIFLLVEARKARLHPVVSRCTDCHETQPAGDVTEVADHPTIFQCRDCHGDIVRSFAQRPHAGKVECRTCHLFHLENERAGRMYKNGNAMFCLLCHEKKSFKDPDNPPKISWPAHIGRIPYVDAVDQRLCLECHRDHIHAMRSTTVGSPHPAEWRTGHRAFLMTRYSGRLADARCSDCHTAPFCADCHKTPMPHPQGFGEAHSDEVTKRGMPVCRTCHTRDYCGTCHDAPW